jgi:hypothetical protein
MKDDQVDIARLIRRMMTVVVALGLINAGFLLVRLSGHDHLKGLIPLFDLNEEQNIPTFVTGLFWIANAFAMVLLTIYRTTGWLRIGWSGFSMIALYMAYDELFMVHEKWEGAGKALAHALFGSSPYFAWIFVGCVAVAVVAIVGLTMYRQIHPQLRMRLFLAGSLFVGGAIGFEWFEGQRVEVYGRSDVLFHGLVLCEEVIELTAILLAFRAMLLELQRQNVRFEFRS